MDNAKIFFEEMKVKLDIWVSWLGGGLRGSRNDTFVLCTVRDLNVLQLSYFEA